MPDEVTPDSEEEAGNASVEAGSDHPLAPRSKASAFKSEGEARNATSRLAEKLLDFQGKELDIREKELTAEQSQQNNAYDYSKAVLKIQADVFMQESKLRHGRFLLGAWIGAGLVVCSFVFLGVLALTGHEQIAQEILKDVVLVLGGGGGGYCIAKRKSVQPQQQPESDPSSENEN